ncbi:hypothetical protein [Paraburkholderia aspalathi]|uniref:hypothetical protein n=1 Tax=Paraburkholderia aspalathi TaxID=1324617 RepID=UPI0038BC1F5F
MSRILRVPSRSTAEASKTDPRPDVFSSGADAAVDNAFGRLKAAGFSQYRKIYLLAHGGVSGVEKPWIVKGGENEDFTAPELAGKFMDQGGMREALKRYLDTALRSKSAADKGFNTSLRLLSCETGREPDNLAEGQFSTNSRTYLEDFGKQIGREIMSIVKQLKVDSQLADKYYDASFSIEITLAAPKGWSVILTNGQNVVYHTDSKHENSADGRFAAIFEKLKDKADAASHQRIKDFVLLDAEKKQKLTLRVGKFARQNVTFDFS